MTELVMATMNTMPPESSMRIVQGGAASSQCSWVATVIAAVALQVDKAIFDGSTINTPSML